MFTLSKTKNAPIYSKLTRVAIPSQSPIMVLFQRQIFHTVLIFWAETAGLVDA
jgi:hypothetical protein